MFCTTASSWTRGLLQRLSVKNTAAKLLLILLSGGLRAKRFLRAKQGAKQPVYDIVDAGPRHRFCTPFAVAHNCLGLGYGCGSKKFVTVAKAMARLDITLDEAKTAVDEYRASNPLVTNRWRQHQFWLRVSANHGDETHEVELGNGRVVRYFNPHVLPDGDPTRPEIAANVVKGDARQLRRFYGGKLTENETQANARNILGGGIEGLEKAGVPVSFHVHDEVVCVVDESQAKEAVPEIERILTTSATWAHTCPLAVETVVVPRYCK